MTDSNDLPERSVRQVRVSTDLLDALSAAGVPINYSAQRVTDAILRAALGDDPSRWVSNAQALLAGHVQQTLQVSDHRKSTERRRVRALTR